MNPQEIPDYCCPLWPNCLDISECIRCRTKGEKAREETLKRLYQPPLSPQEAGRGFGLMAAIMLAIAAALWLVQLQELGWWPF